MRQQRTEPFRRSCRADLRPTVTSPQRVNLVDVKPLCGIGTLGRMPSTRMVDEHSTHRLRSERGALRTVVRLHRPITEQAQTGLVDQRRSLQGVSIAFVTQRAGRQRLQLGIDDRRQAIKRTAVARAAACKQIGDFLDVHSVQRSAGLPRTSHAGGIACKRGDQ